MADLRGGSTVGGRPILSKEARDNYLGKIVGNKVKESIIYDDGSKVTINGIADVNSLNVKTTAQVNNKLTVQCDSATHQFKLVRTGTSAGSAHIGIVGTELLFMDGATTDAHLKVNVSSGDVTTGRNLIVTGVADVNGDVLFNNNALISNNGGTANIDHIWHDDGSNLWHFVSDGTYKQEGNATLVVEEIKVRKVAGRHIQDYMLRDHGNGNVTISAQGAELYLGYTNTTKVRMSADLYSNTGNEFIMDATGTNMGVSNHANKGANVLLNFYNNIPRIRYGGAGEGANNGFQIAGSGDSVKMEVTENGHVLAYGGYFKSGTGGNVVVQSDNGYCVIRAGSTQNIYLQTLGNVRVVQPNTTSTYMPIYASQFAVNSVESAKEEIVEFGESALDMVNKEGKIYEYKLKAESEKPNRKRKLGFVIGREVPTDLTDSENEGVDLYAMNSILWKAVQELTQTVEDLRNEVSSKK
jgi:hypothetical protein